MSSHNPFTYLAKLAAHYKQAAPKLPAQEVISSSWNGIGFNLQGHRMIAPMGNVVEMLTVPEATPLPGVQPWVVGLANVRGRLLPLFDLEVFFGGKLGANKSRHRVLVIEIGELYAGLIVSEVYGMQSIADETQSEEVPEAAEAVAPYSSGAYARDGLLWINFSPNHLIRDPRFFNASVA